MPSAQPIAGGKRLLWAVAILALLSVVTAIGFDVFRRATRMRVAPTNAAITMQAQPGQKQKAVILLKALESTDLYSAVLLESSDGSTYHQTTSAIRLAVTPNTSVVMGRKADIKTGAILQVNGQMTAEHTLRASQIVVLTGFVNLAPGT